MNVLNDVLSKTSHVENILQNEFSSHRRTGCGSSIGSEFAWHASGPEFDPNVRDILSWRHELVSKFNVGLKTLLHQGLSEPEFYGGLVYKFKRNCR